MIGQRIAALRKDALMSQAELARELGVSPSAVGMYEQGRREPSAETLVHLSKIFRVSTDYLLTGELSRAGDEEILARILDGYAGLTSQRLELRKDLPFSRQELMVLFAAMLAES